MSSSGNFVFFNDLGLKQTHHAVASHYVLKCQKLLDLHFGAFPFQLVPKYGTVHVANQPLTGIQKDILSTYYAWDRLWVQFFLWWARHCGLSSWKGPWHAWLGSSHVSPKLT